MTNGWGTMGLGIMSQLGTSQAGRAEEGGGSLKGWLVEEMGRGAVGRSESPSRGWVPTHEPRMMTRPWHNNASIMVYTVLTIVEWASRERVRTHCVQRYMFAWPGNECRTTRFIEPTIEINCCYEALNLWTDASQKQSRPRQGPMVQLVQIKTLRETKLAKTNVRTMCKKRIIFQAVKTRTSRSKNLTHAEDLFC